jgi:hypothetical protein
MSYNSRHSLRRHLTIKTSDKDTCLFVLSSYVNKGPDSIQGTTSENHSNWSCLPTDGYKSSLPLWLHITIEANAVRGTTREDHGDWWCSSADGYHQLFTSLQLLWDTKSDMDDKGLFGDRAKVFKLHCSVQHSKQNQTLKLFDAASISAILLTTDVAAHGFINKMKIDCRNGILFPF